MPDTLIEYVFAGLAASVWIIIAVRAWRNHRQVTKADLSKDSRMDLTDEEWAKYDARQVRRQVGIEHEVLYGYDRRKSKAFEV